MIIAPQNDSLRIITQNDHAHFAAEFLKLWRRDGLPEHPRRAAILFAAREHDNGWAEADSAPRVDPGSGRPLDFLSISDDLRRQLWRRGVERFLEEAPWAAALIVQHALHLHRKQDEEPGWRDLLAGWRQQRDELLETAGADRQTLLADYRWIETSDTLSLGLSSAWRKSLELHGWQLELDGQVVRIEPFPLAGATTFRIPCREIPARRYASDADLAIELASARWRGAQVRVEPA